MNNFWGPSDDEEPLPAWMDPNTYRNQPIKQRSSKTVAQAAEEALKLPPVPIIIQEPKIDGTSK